VKYLVSYASPKYEPYRQQLNGSALAFGIEKTLPYKPEDLNGTEFYRKNKGILASPKGAGYWLWKPYIILDAMSKAEEDAILIYSDADNMFHSAAEPLAELCQAQGGMIFFKTMSYINRSWTKRDCFVLMDCDAPAYWNADHLWAGLAVFVNNARSQAFVKEWLSYCVNPNIIGDQENGTGLGNFPEFIEHRYDQSVLSLLAVKHGIPSFRDLQFQHVWPDLKWRRN
jgi:hypothetical protein